MRFGRATGQTAGTKVSLAVICTGVCGSASNFPSPSPAVPGRTINARMEYADRPATIDYVTPQYTLTAGPIPITPATWSAPAYRCDAVLSGAGCVQHNVWPELTTMTNLPAIAANIRSIQAAGPNHYGGRRSAAGRSSAPRTRPRRRPTVTSPARKAALGRRASNGL